MALPFVVIANAQTDENTSEEKMVVDWDDAIYLPLLPANDFAYSSYTEAVYNTCEHAASLDNKCYGWDSSGNFYYSTPIPTKM